MDVDLILGTLGAEAPAAGDDVLLLLGAIEGAADTMTDATLAAVVRLAVEVVAGVAVLGPGARLVAPWDTAAAAPPAAAVAPWRSAAAPMITLTARMPWLPFSGRPSGALARMPWDAAQPLQRDAVAPWGPAGTVDHRAALPWGVAADRSGAWRAPWGVASGRPGDWRAPWGLALLLPAPNLPLPGGPGTHGTVPRGLGVDLVLCVPVALDSTDLVLGLHQCTSLGRIADGTSIGARRSYVHTHTLAAYRLPDMTPVPLTAIDLSADEAGFGWTLRAAARPEALDILALVDGLPATLRVTLDGLSWDVVVEGLGRTREHGRTGATITGRSISALAGAPYAAETARLNAVPATAQQLVDDALAYTGLALEWRVDDWLVPAGAWSFTGTPLAAARRVAEAIDAMLQSPRTGEVLIVAPRYTVPPWEWGAADPDVTLALDAVFSEGFERRDQPAYEGVYVSGQAQGVAALVKRTGTAPALLMPTVTDPLITDLVAARQRGTAMLGRAGAQADVSLTLPVLTGAGEPGVIDPGKLVRLDDPAGAWTGRVRSVALRADWLTARQTLVIERHL